MKVNNEKQLAITVDYSMTLEQMVAAGGYGWVHDTVRRLWVRDYYKVVDPFSVGKVKRVAYLIRFNLNRPFTTRYILREFTKQGKRPGTIEELLAFGATCPDVPKSEIVALGSSYSGRGPLYVPALGSHDSERCLDLVKWKDGGWNCSFLFLAFDKDRGA